MAGKVVFQADTSQFTTPVERSATVVRDLSKALNEQKKAAQDAYRDQVTNAKAAGASVEELQRIEQERYRSLLAIQAVQKQISAENVSNGKADVNSAQSRAAAENLVTEAYQKQLFAVNATFGAIKQQHAEVAGSIAGGAAIRTVDGGQNVRAVENFLAKTLNLGPVLQNLFPLVGGIAFVQILVDAGEKLYEMTQKAKESSKALQEAMEDAHAKTQVTIDDLTIEADKLQLNIDKLSGHPGNGLQLGLDEAKKAADELLASLQSDRKEMEALFKQTHVSGIEGWFSGSNPTGGEEKDIKARRESLEKSLRDTNDDYNKKASGATSDEAMKAIEKARRTALADVLSGAVNSINGERSDLVKGNTVIEADRSGSPVARVTNQNDARIAQLDYYKNQVQSQLDLMNARKRVGDLARQEQTLKGGKDNAGIAKTAADEQRQLWATQLKERQKDGDMTTAQEREFWLARLQVVQVGSINYLSAYDKFLDATKKQAEQQRKQFEDLRKANNEASKQQTEEMLKALNPGAVAQSRGIVNAIDSGSRLDDAKTRAGYSGAESDINYQLRTKQITEMDAAMQLQTLHTAEYRQQLAQLNAQLSAVRDDDQDAAAKRNGFKTQIVDLNSRRASQVNQDRSSTWVGSTSGTAGANEALADFVRSTRDAATQMRTITESVLYGLNDNLSNAIVGGQTNWSGTFRGIGKQVANTGLEKVEGSVLGAFGLGGKPDGSASNPLNVKIVDGSGVPGGIGGLFGGGDSDSDSGGAFFASLFGGARAAGGPVSAGNAYLVGENGPEPFLPSTSGTILPNSSLGGGGDTHNWNIDARGSHDPAATEAAVRRGIAQATPAIIASSVSATSERNRRLPSTTRR
jgi:hypothetical protein